MESMTLFIEQRRGFAVEATHAIDAVSCTASGKVSVLSGVDALTTFRSAAKPFQLEATLARLPAALRGALDAPDLALGSASHHGEPLHMDALARLLAKLGCDVGDLYCGAHPPQHPASAAALIAAGAPATALHNNCAGKHAFMAAAARARGEPEDYRPRAHPLQQAILASLAVRTAGGVVDTVTDGCGLPCFVLPLSAMARAYAQLALEAAALAPSPLGGIGQALRAHPRLASGSDGFDGWLMEQAEVIAKVGAAGLICIAIPERGLGLAIKVRSGSELARPLAATTLLSMHVPELPLPPLPAPLRVVTNVVGAEVGAWVTRLEAD
jgi:L-asparaginase II